MKRRYFVYTANLYNYIIIKRWKKSQQFVALLNLDICAFNWILLRFYLGKRKPIGIYSFIKSLFCFKLTFENFSTHMRARQIRTSTPFIRMRSKSISIFISTYIIAGYTHTHSIVHMRQKNNTNTKKKNNKVIQYVVIRSI